MFLNRLRPSLKIGALLAWIAAGLQFAGSTALAADRIWSGNGADNRWTNSGNWNGGIAPVTGDSLQFPAGAARLSNTNNFAAGTSFRMLTFSGAGYLSRGNTIGVSNGISATHASGTTTLNLPVTLRNDSVFAVSESDASLSLLGSINLNNMSVDFDGAGLITVSNEVSRGGTSAGNMVRKLGAGRLLILRNPTYNLPTIVNGGTLQVDGTLSNSVVTVNAGGTLQGLGKVGGVIAGAGATVRPGTTNTGDLESLDDVALNAGSTFEVRLNGATAGTQYDQLRVRGTVTLGGTLAVSAGFVPASGALFTIIDNDGSENVTGEFAGLPDGALLTLNGRSYRILYGNDVVLEAMPGASVWDGGGGTPFWTEGLNWVGDQAPQAGDTVQFGPANSVSSNNFGGVRVVGTMIFAGGHHQMHGNGLDLTGGIQMNQPGLIEIYNAVVLRTDLALTNGTVLSLNGAITLPANRVFRVQHPDSFLRMQGDLNLGANVATFDVTARADIYGRITGAGSVIKNGPGTLVLWGNGEAAGPITVNAGTFFAQGSITGPLNVNAGAVASLLFGPYGHVEAQGGTVTPGFTTVNGNVRLLAGSTFGAWIGTNLNQVRNTSITTTGTVNITGCTLSLDMANNLPIDTGDEFRLIDLTPANRSVTGTFVGLAEGATINAGGYTFRISYVGGTGNDVTLTRVTAGGSNLSSISALGNGVIRLQGTGSPNTGYTIQAATNLHPVIQWTPVGRSTGDISGAFQFFHTNPPALRMRFYRAVSP